MQIYRIFGCHVPVEAPRVRHSRHATAAAAMCAEYVDFGSMEPHSPTVSHSQLLWAVALYCRIAVV